MKVRLTITDSEVREAIRSWCADHGIPNAVVEELKVMGEELQRGGWIALRSIRVEVEYEADSLTAHEGRVGAQVVQAESIALAPYPSKGKSW